MKIQSRPLGWTTLKESKKLLKAGLSPDTADMHIISYQDDKGGYFDTALCYSKWDAVHTEDYYPCWSLGVLFQLLPLEICIVNDARMTYYLSINKYPIDEFVITYASDTALLKGDYIGFVSPKDGSFMECVVKMVIWLLEHDYIKKGE